MGNNGDSNNQHQKAITIIIQQGEWIEKGK
jgi:hypothetical protein